MRLITCQGDFDSQSNLRSLLGDVTAQTGGLDQNTLMTSAQEQSTGVAQISQAVVDLERIAMQNAELVGESSGSARDLFAHTAMLTSTIHVFEQNRHRQAI